MKVIFTEKPSVIEAVGDGTFRYRCNIEDVETDEGVRFNADEVIVYPLDDNAVLSAVLNELYGNGIEQKLQNDYFAEQTGILPSGSGDKYMEFLRKRLSLKEQISNDINEYKK